MRSDRRNFLKTVGASAAGFSVAPPLALAANASPEKAAIHDDQILFIGDDIAVAKTTYGKVRGYILRDIYCFLGMPYGADTSGKNRFMPPKKPNPWTDVFPAIWWGNSAPQNLEKIYANRIEAFSSHPNYDDVGEDCLSINVWTPSCNDGRKRAVLVYLHGGGFGTGNGHAGDSYNGENFSRHGDIVFCSLNHRLGPLGYSNFAGVAGEKFAASGNLGVLDIVAALEWVRDNIANFGGDPANVTIMGQSGGGSKVTTITAMPSAKGLFHKAVVLSGGTMRSNEKEFSERVGALILKEAGLTASQIDKLQEMPWPEYNKLAFSAAKNGGPGGWVNGAFSPVVDGYYLPQHPYFPEAPTTADNVPMLICSTLDELAPSRADALLENITLAEVIEKVKVKIGPRPGLGDKARETVEAYAKSFPGRKPVGIWSMLLSSPWRTTAIALANAKIKQPAPVYLAWFGWQPPLFDRRMRAFHCLDICFWLYNTDIMLTFTGGGSRPRKLASKMAGALLAFMKSGNPNNGELPTWPKYSSAKGETMMLDDVCEVKNDSDREARKTLQA
ncbi:MAG: carboxylesterase family protein [Verrucomicrobiota bacterium]